MTKHLLLLSLAIAAVLPATTMAQCSASNVIVNGSFVSAEGEAVTASGWTPGSTPDVNDENGPLNCTVGYIWTGVPVASPDGGTWQNLYGTESIEQTVALNVGQTYALTFQYAAQGIMADSTYMFDDPTGFTVYMNNAVVYTTPLDQTQFTWEQAVYTFVATTATTTVRFMETTGGNYVGLDGVCLGFATGEGIGEAALLAQQVYPNPADAFVSLPVGKAVASDLRVVNAIGALVPAGIRVRGDRAQVDTATLPNGIYFVERSGTAHLAPVRFVVSHR
ncbi:MAG: T9SS type A sorting domain-containing protein [Flavobacteriales bacterium]